VFTDDARPRPHDDGDLAHRRLADQYELRRELARGGMAIVYLAYQPALEREVALKELAVFPFSNATLAERFVLESQVTGGLSSPNIVTVYDYFEADGRPYIAMEYLERGSLRPLVGKLTLAQVAGVLEGVLAGLAHAETHGVVHRDIKPENLLVTDDGRVKIADFGIAKAYSTVPNALTAEGTALGTPGYMAPEQALGHDIGPWTDLYAVGVVAYELLVGQLPFEADGWSVLLRHVNDPVPPPRARRPDLDPAVDQWVLRMLAKDPADRPRSAQDAWEQLENAIVSREGAMWRRGARLPLADGADAAKPLSEAECPSVLASGVIGAGGRSSDRDGSSGGAARAGSMRDGPRDQVGDRGSDSGSNPPFVRPGDEGDASSVPGTRRRRRRTIAGGALAAVLGIAGTAGIAMRPHVPQVDMPAVERIVRDQLAADYAITSVTCPAAVRAAPGASFECEATIRGGQPMHVTVEQVGSGFRVTPHL